MGSHGNEGGALWAFPVQAKKLNVILDDMVDVRPWASREVVPYRERGKEFDPLFSAWVYPKVAFNGGVSAGPFTFCRSVSVPFGVSAGWKFGVESSAWEQNEANPFVVWKVYFNDAQVPFLVDLDQLCEEDPSSSCVCG